SSDDVGPGATADLLAALVDRDRLEHVVAAAVGFGDVLHRCGGGDFVARHDGLAPLELLAAVHHHREVELDLGVEDRGPDRRRAVDDREHRGREQVGVAGRASRIQVHAHGIALADRPRVLADLLAPDGVGHGLVGLADRFGVDRHRAAGVYAHARAGGATAASPTRAARRRPPEAPPAGVTGERSEGRRGPVARPTSASASASRSPGGSMNWTVSATMLTAWRFCSSAVSHSRQLRRPSTHTRLPRRMYVATFSPRAPKTDTS